MNLKPVDIQELYNLSPKLKSLLAEHGINILECSDKIEVVLVKGNDS